jgi:predicted kinase
MSEPSPVVKRVYILQGAQGAGKSTFTRRYSHARVCSADKFFEGPDGYKHDPKRIGEAHAWCLREYVDAILAGLKTPAYAALIVVDNTNSARWEMAPYAQLAKAYGYEIETHTFLVDPKVAFDRNQHNVPWETLLRTVMFMDPPLATWGRHTVHLPDGTSFSSHLDDPEPGSVDKV